MNREFENFNQAMHKLIRVSHEEIKAKLDAEKVAKKKRKAKKPSASDRASDEKD